MAVKLQQLEWLLATQQWKLLPLLACGVATAGNKSAHRDVSLKLPTATCDEPAAYASSARSPARKASRLTLRRVTVLLWALAADERPSAVWCSAAASVAAVDSLEDAAPA